MLRLFYVWNSIYHLQYSYKSGSVQNSMYLRLFLNFTWELHVGGETSFKSEKRKRLFSGGHLKIRPLMRSAPIVLCTPEVSPHKANMRLKLEHIFVYGWGAQHHRAASYPTRKQPGFTPSSVPVIFTWRCCRSVAMVRTVFSFTQIVVNAVRYRRKASVRGVTKATEIVSSQNRWRRRWELIQGVEE